MEPTESTKWASAFKEYSEARKVNGNAIADMALENFEEVASYVSFQINNPTEFCCVQMRDRVSDRSFLLQKRLENRIENAFPEKFRSRYAMVCYGGAGNVTYRNAFDLGKVQVRNFTCY